MPSKEAGSASKKEFIFIDRMASGRRTNRPVLGITMGDPAGIGPEIIVKALASPMVYRRCRPLVIGDAAVIEQARRVTKQRLSIRQISCLEEADFRPGGIDVYDLRNVNLAQLRLGIVSAMAGKAAFEAITTAIRFALDGAIDGVVTAPIHKEAVRRAGYAFAGHTEIFAHYTKTRDYAMMLVEGSLRVIHVTTHIALRDACDLIKQERVLSVIRLAHNACQQLGIRSPRIAVAGLNPHASDGGLFGKEEEREIIPAIRAAKQQGLRVAGPLPADTLFSQAMGGAYDIVVAMYHDQGHIPVKLCGFKWDQRGKKWKSVSGINITVGLPIIRVSVDHGTAFDQAGKGTASEESMLAAIRYAALMAEHRRRS